MKPTRLKIWNAFTLSLLLSMGCSFQGMEVVDYSSQQKSVVYSPSNLTQALRTASNTLVMRNPTQSEYDEAAKGVDGYATVILRYLEDPRFSSPEVPNDPDPELNNQLPNPAGGNNSVGIKGGSLLRHHRNYFELAGAPQGNPVNRNEPANIATYIVRNDRPYWEVLTGNYSVDDNFQATVPQTTYLNREDSDANAAGIITTRAWIFYNASPYNFHIVNMAFQKFLCSEYPDADDIGMSKDFISDQRKTFTSNNNGGMDCFFCHRSINPKAYLYFAYYKDLNVPQDQQGMYAPAGLDPAQNLQTTRTDMANVNAIPEDVLCNKQPDPSNPSGVCKKNAQNRVIRERVSVTVDGKPVNSVKDLGKIMSLDPRFAKCATQQYVNWMFGLGPKTKLTKDMEYLVEIFRGTPDNKPYNVKRLILEIAKSSQFVNR